MTEKIWIDSSGIIGRYNYKKHDMRNRLRCCSRNASKRPTEEIRIKFPETCILRQRQLMLKYIIIYYMIYYMI